MDRARLEPELTIPVQVEYRVEPVYVPSYAYAKADPDTGELTGETGQTEPISGYRVVSYWQSKDGTESREDRFSYSVWPTPEAAIAEAKGKAEMTRAHFEELRASFPPNLG